MAITGTAEFLELLEKSRLLEADQLEQAHNMVEDGDRPKALAKRLVKAGLITSWQGTQMLAGRSSFFLGKYKLLRLLGRGGMGGVFLSEHITMNRRVAIKTISRSISGKPSSLDRFLSEARAIAALDHPNIVQAYSVDNEEDRFYLVMEFIEGQDLKRMVKTRGPLEPVQAAVYIRQAAEGLEHGHRRGIIHCDIKPSNLLVNQQGVVKIVDMGVSRLQDPEQSSGKDLVDAGVLGSVDYMAPEQALGAKDFNHRADIYALGCTFYFLLTGQPPFPEGSLHERLMKHQEVDPPRISEFRLDVPDTLVETCEKMMVKSPDARYQVAAEVAAALAKLPALERKAKRGLPLRKAEPLPEPEQEILTTVDIDDSGGQDRRDPRWPVAVERALQFFDSPKRKIIAGGVVVAVVVLLLLAIVVPQMIGSPDPEKEQDDWLAPVGPKRPDRKGEIKPERVEIAHWTLDDPAGTGSAHDSCRAYGGTTAGAVAFLGSGANPNTGASASFTGTGCIDVPYCPELNPKSFTLTAWAKVTGGSGFRSVVSSRYDRAANSEGYTIYVTPENQWQFWTGDGTRTATPWHPLNGGSAAMNEWIHLAISYDASTGAKLFYLNGGIPAISTTQGYAANSLRDLHIGGGGDNGTDYRFVGNIDDVLLFNKVLDQTAIQNIMNKSMPDPE